MRQQIEVVIENGVLRPSNPLPVGLREGDHLIVFIDDLEPASGWLAGADPMVSLEAVRQALAKVPGTLAQAVAAERADR